LYANVFHVDTRLYTMILVDPGSPVFLSLRFIIPLRRIDRRPRRGKRDIQDIPPLDEVRVCALPYIPASLQSLPSQTQHPSLSNTPDPHPRPKHPHTIHPTTPPMRNAVPPIRPAPPSTALCIFILIVHSQCCRECECGYHYFTTPGNPCCTRCSPPRLRCPCIHTGVGAGWHQRRRRTYVERSVESRSVEDLYRFIE